MEAVTLVMRLVSASVPADRGSLASERRHTITQVTTLFAHDPGWTRGAEAMLVLALVW